MVQNLIDNMNIALDANAYLAALSIALMLPDICGKAEYPNEDNVGKRYKAWFDEYIGQYEKSPSDDDFDIKMPYLSGEIIYQLRNSFLHQGNPNVNKNKIKEERNQIDEFQLVIQKKNEFDIYVDSSGVENGEKRSYSVNVRRLCLIIGLSASAYYKRNIDKFDFFNYSILDWDETIARFNI